MEKAQEVLEGTIVHRRPFHVEEGIWHFVVVGPHANGASVIRAGTAEQARIQAAPIYIATLGGPHIPDTGGIPIEEFASGDLPGELAGLKIFHLSPLRPLSVTSRRQGPSMDEAVAETLERFKGVETAVIETPDEAYWALSVLKYLDESDLFFPDPVLTRFYSRIGFNTRPMLN
ncbi:MAG: hypothetical protein EPO63_09300 [Candidatus Nitrosotenuis sp.]|nr:MAG: hypothetical protein EPO63_09300 [Candidatus Nitrosotenuis sp.]